MSDNEEENEYEKRMIEDNVSMMKCALFTIESILNRQRKIDDPVVRYSVFVDKLSMMLDISMGVVKGFTDNDKYPVDLKDKMDKVYLDFQNDLDDLMSWVRKPVYSPDHPYGSQIMDQSNVDFNGKSQK